MKSEKEKMIEKQKSVVILLSTYNGSKFINEQLQSIKEQKISERVRVFIRDDGSDDETCLMLSRWSEKLDITIIRGENVGPRNSFYKLIQTAPEADYYAFCNQDDIWHCDKIKSAITKLSDKENVEALYFCNARLVNKDGIYYGRNRDLESPGIILEQLFVSNPAIGCSMVFNSKFMGALKRLPINLFFMHDVAAIILAAAIGNIIYDATPRLDYRQHEKSVTQGHDKLRNMRNKVNFWFFQKDISIEKQADAILNIYGEQLKNREKEVLKKIAYYRKGINRFVLIFDRNFKVNSWKCNRSFILRVLLGIA